VLEPICVLTADWHVAKSAWARSGIDGDARAALADVVDYCTAQQLPLIAAGDLFDTPDPAPDDVAAVRAALDRLQAGGCGVYFVQGQHERVPGGTPWLAAIHAWPRHLDGRTFRFARPDGRPLSVHGLDWRPGPRLGAALAAIPAGVDLLVCHQVWRELMGGQAACEGRLADIPGVPWVVTGDLHKHLRRTLTRGDGSTLEVLSPGSLALQSIDEEPRKQFFVLGVDADGDYDVASVPLRSRYARTVDATTPEQLEGLLGSELERAFEAAAARAAPLPPGLARPLLRVRYDPQSSPEAWRRIEAACAGRFHLFPAPTAGRDLAPVDPRAALSALQARGMLGVLAGLPLADLADPDAARADVATLLQAPDVEARLDELIQDP
jgi:hypothetical protein